MIKKVVKNDGTQEDFEIEKVKESIGNACESAQVSEAREAFLIEEISSFVLSKTKEKQAIETKEIKELIISKLDGLEPKVSENWRSYEKEK